MRNVSFETQSWNIHERRDYSNRTDYTVCTEDSISFRTACVTQTKGNVRVPEQNHTRAGCQIFTGSLRSSMMAPVRKTSLSFIIKILVNYDELSILEQHYSLYG